MPFMIAHGASVGLIRDGKRKTISAGTGADFTEDEIIAINRAAPGSLRKPINEGRGEAAPAAVVEEAKPKTAKTAKTEKPETAKQKKARLAREKKEADEAAAAAAGDNDDDEDDDDADTEEGDDDEDEDI